MEWVHAPVSCSIGVLHACTGGGDGFMTRGPEFYILVSCPQMKKKTLDLGIAMVCGPESVKRKILHRSFHRFGVTL